MSEKQKCFLCNKKSDFVSFFTFHSTFDFYFYAKKRPIGLANFDSRAVKECFIKIPICVNCRKEPIYKIYDAMVKHRYNELKKGGDK